MNPQSAPAPKLRKQSTDPLTLIVYAAVATCIALEPLLMCIFLFG